MARGRRCRKEEERNRWRRKFKGQGRPCVRQMRYTEMQTGQQVAAKRADQAGETIPYYLASFKEVLRGLIELVKNKSCLDDSILIRSIPYRYFGLGLFVKLSRCSGSPSGCPSDCPSDCASDCASDCLPGCLSTIVLSKSDEFWFWPSAKQERGRGEQRLSRTREKSTRLGVNLG
eukprot:750654-Hanusia_phi.AAC.3